MAEVQDEHERPGPKPRTAGRLDRFLKRHVPRSTVSPRWLPNATQSEFLRAARTVHSTPLSLRGKTVGVEYRASYRAGPVPTARRGPVGVSVGVTHSHSDLVRDLTRLLFP